MKYGLRFKPCQICFLIGGYNIVNYIKYVFGHLDDHNIFLIYIWFLSPVHSSEFTSLWEFPVRRVITVSFVLLMR